MGGARARRGAGRSHRHRLLPVGRDSRSGHAQRVVHAARVVPLVGLAADRRFAPDYPGITAARSLADWDPPFPIDLSRVRPQDERYWDEYKTTPKAFIAYERGRDLWQSRYGALTSIRIADRRATAAATCRSHSRRAAHHALAECDGRGTLSRARGRARGAQGATDFGQYFTYFSFFLMVSALMLAVLFFKLGVEQRLRQVGILRASGYSMSIVRRLLLGEAIILAAIGGVLGIAGAVLYGKADRARPRHMVGRRGRDDAAGTACQAALAGVGGDWRMRGRDACVFWSRFAPSVDCRHARC